MRADADTCCYCCCAPQGLVPVLNTPSAPVSTLQSIGAVCWPFGHSASFLSFMSEQTWPYAAELQMSHMRGACSRLKLACMHCAQRRT